MIKFDFEKKISSISAYCLRIFERGKLQIELEQLKWKLRKKYRNLGEYVSTRKESQSIMDFSHDEVYQKKINEIIKLKFYIDDHYGFKKKV